MNATKPSKQEQKIIEQARKSLPPLGAPRPSATANLDPLRDADMSFSVLPIDQIEIYVHNPRQGLNPRYEELKASIKADGITNILTVTRRSVDGKYAPYGGGNTRLAIAKELFAEGDKRFAHLKVIVKEWPGDAQVITAHLVENELRADITFWEKARGVHQFRVESEREQGRPLTAGELNRELRSRGLNYGVRTIQNFLFAMEQLAPVGPWLKAREVNETIRPLLSALLELGAKLGSGPALREPLQRVMREHGTALRQRAKQNEDLDEAEREPVELDEAAFLSDLEHAAAQQLTLERHELAAMLTLLSNEPKLSPEALRSRARSRSASPQAPARSPLPIDPGDPFEPTDLKPPQALAPAAVQQAPLAGMLASVPAQPLPAVPKAPAAVSPDASQSLQEALGGIRKLLNEVNETVPLHDVLCGQASMPFGFLVDLPLHDMARAFDVPVRADLVPLRAALWKLLAALSYQYDRRVIDRISPLVTDQTLWTGTCARGQAAFERACVDHAGLQVSGTSYQMGMDELALVLATPDVGYPFIRLLSAMESVRLNFPQQVPEGFEPLFKS